MAKFVSSLSDYRCDCDDLEWRQQIPSEIIDAKVTKSGMRESS
jgi:hypothetical protein